MKNTKKELGQFFSKNSELIEHFIHRIENDDILIDPFAGDLDLLKPFKNKRESYDLLPLHEETIKNDSFLNPPNFSGKFIITNPPYLNINKAANKEIFELYNTDDLYKVALKTIIQTGTKGIIIVPSAFWFNERSSGIRKEFLTLFNVPEVKVFNKQMFEDTTYTVCSFYFERDVGDLRNVEFAFLGNNKGVATLTYSKENNYSIINDVEDQLMKIPKSTKIGRYTKKEQLPTHIFLNCLDTSQKIAAEIKEPYMGINTDRAFLTFTLEGETLNEEEEFKMVELFNQELNKFRVLYADSFLSNYRNDGRKRIGFTFAYKLFGHCLLKIKNEKISAY